MEELLTGSGKLDWFIFHYFNMKDITRHEIIQEKNYRTSQNCFGRAGGSVW